MMSAVGKGKKKHFYKEDVWGLFLALVDIGKTYICEKRYWMCCCVTECVNCSRLADKAIKKKKFTRLFSVIIKIGFICDNNIFPLFS